jgi:hypothetical protein
MYGRTASVRAGDGGQDVRSSRRVGWKTKYYRGSVSTLNTATRGGLTEIGRIAKI